MNNINITFGFFIVNCNTTQNICAVIKVFEQISRVFNLQYSKLAYSYKNEKEKQINKNLIYSQKNINRIIEIDSQFKINSLEMYTMFGDGYIAKDTDLSTIYYLPEQKSEPIKIVVEIKSNYLVKESDCTNIFINIAKYIETTILPVKYALSFPMEKDKMPTMFLGGIGNKNLSDFERNLATILLHNEHKYAEKIWDVFWGNILNENHFAGKKDAILKELRKIVGEKSVKEIDDGRVYFNLPVDIFKYDIEEKKYENYRSKVRKLFKKYDLLMHE